MCAHIWVNAIHTNGDQAQLNLPKLCALMKAILLVPGLIRMKPISLCSGFFVSAFHEYMLK